MRQPEDQSTAKERYQHGMALIRAARDGRIDALRELLAAHPEWVDWVDRAGGIRKQPGRTALWAAADGGEVESVRLLLEAGASVNAHDPRLDRPAYEKAKSEISSTLLHYVASRGHGELIRPLVEHGMAVNARDEWGNTPLHLAASNMRKINALRSLLELGADPRAENLEGDEPIHFAYDETTLVALLEAGASPDTESADDTPLLKAIRSGDAGRVRLLLEAGADPQRRVRRGLPLDVAAFCGHTECARLLLEAGAAVEGLEGESRTPLEAAALRAHPEIVDLLLDAGAQEIDAALHEAAWGSAFNDRSHLCVKRLIEAGADANYQKAPGRQAPLHRAAFAGNARSVRLLLGAGAELDTRDGQGKTPLWTACRQGKIEVVECLLEAGVDVGAKNDEGKTPRQAARMTSEGRAIKSLLDRHEAKKHEKNQSEPRPPAEPAAGDRVRHVKFGDGSILGMTGSGDQLKLEIDFETAGTKQILARFVKPL